MSTRRFAPFAAMRLVAAVTALIAAGLAPSALGQGAGGGTRPIGPTLPIAPTNPIGPTNPIAPPGIGVLPIVPPGTGNPGGIVVSPSPGGRIIADTGILVGDTSQAQAVVTNQVAAAPGAGGTAPSTTYLWTISGGRIIGSTTGATVNYVADSAGTVTLGVTITAPGVSANASSTVTALSGATAGAITAPATAAAGTAPTSPTLTVSVPAAQNNDRTFRWSVSGDAVITAGQGTNSARIRPGSPGVKEVTCDVTLQRLATVTLRSYVVVNGDGPPTTVTVTDGAGGGTYNANSRVDIFANPPPSGQVFDRWTGDLAVFGANAPLAPFVTRNVITVPTTPVSLVATYKPAPVWTPTTLANFNPQSQTTGTGAAAITTTTSTTLTYHLPPDAAALVFLLHDTASTGSSWFNTPEGLLLTRDLVAAGYGVAALNSASRTDGAWSTGTTVATNADARHHLAALDRFIQEGLPSATKPIFLLGFGGGADAAVNLANLLATASPPRPVRGTVLYCTAGSESLAVTSRVPQFYALAANDTAATNTAARANVQLLAGRGLAAGSVTNAVSPVHSGRFRKLGVNSATFTGDDASAIWTALKTANILDANNYLKSLPTAAALTAALPEAHRSRASEVAAQLSIASARREFFSDANARVINFLNTRLAGAPAPAPGRIVNLSTRGTIGYVGDSFSLGFNLGGGTERATLLVRGVGPGLARYGVTGALVAPRLEINDSAGRLIAANEGWTIPGGAATPAQLNAAATAVGTFPLANGSLDTAVVLTNLAPGTYTATLRGVNGSAGEVLAEVYDLSRNSTRLTNLSALAKISAEGEVIIPGIVVQGANPRTLVVRAIGPGLGDFGIPANAILTDPRVSVFNANRVVVDTNNNWTLNNPATLSAVFPAVGAFPLKTTNAADAALVTAVNPGSYTVQAGSAPLTDGTTANPIGSVLVEIYEVP
jgi:hypothetical protein